MNKSGRPELKRMEKGVQVGVERVLIRIDAWLDLYCDDGTAEGLDKT